MMPQDAAHRVGNALGQALKAAGKSHRELAAILHVHPSRISHWVHGRNMMPAEYISPTEKFLRTNLSTVLAAPPPEYELFIAAPFGGLADEDVPKHQAETEKVVKAVREIVDGVYWPSEAAKTAEHRRFILSDIRTEDNLRILNECPALLYVQFTELIGPSSAYIELGYALGKGKNVVIMVKQGLRVPYMLRNFGTVAANLNFLAHPRPYTDIASAEDAAERIAANGRKLFGLV